MTRRGIPHNPLTFAFARRSLADHQPDVDKFAEEIEASLKEGDKFALVQAETKLRKRLSGSLGYARAKDLTEEVSLKGHSGGWGKLKAISKVRVRVRVGSPSADVKEELMRILTPLLSDIDWRLQRLTRSQARPRGRRGRGLFELCPRGARGGAPRRRRVLRYDGVREIGTQTPI